MADINPLQGRAINIALEDSGLLRLGNWSLPNEALHPLTEIPTQFRSLRIRVQDLEAFPIILQYQTSEEWKETQGSIQCLSILISDDKISDIPAMVEHLNQVLNMIEVETIILTIDAEISLNGLEFANGIKELIIEFTSVFQNFSMRTLIPVALIPYLESLTIRPSMYYNSNTDEDDDSLVLENNSSLNYFSFMRENYGIGIPESRDSRRSKVVIRNCPALTDIVVRECDIEMDSSLPIITLLEASLPKFLGVQPERFYIGMCTQNLQKLKQYRVRYLNVICIDQDFEPDDLPLGELEEFILRYAQTDSFEFLARAPNLRYLVIENANLIAFNRWNNTLEPERRFNVVDFEGKFKCTR